MKKELKRQIKQDQLMMGIGRAAEWMRAHSQEVRITSIAIVVVAAGAAGLAYFQQQRGNEADRAFAAALETYQAPVASELPPDFEGPKGPVFATAKEKFEKAAAAFEGIDRRYGSLPAGRRARYYAALCQMELGDAPGAEKALASIAASSGGEALEPALARLALADLKRRTGQIDQAVDAYRQLAEDRSFALPRDHALMSLAATLEEAHRVDEARAAYQRLAEEFPASVYAPEARRRAEYLNTPAGRA